MVEALKTTLRGSPLLLLALLVLPSSANAHVLDEYLQATLVDVGPGAVLLQINLTPGVEIAEQVLALIDRDHDREISSGEAYAYAELLKHDLAARLDGHDVELKLTASNIPPSADLHTGLGIIQMEFSLTPGALSTGVHKLTIENRHMPSLGVYLFNAATPRSELVKITRQTRNENQSIGEIEFQFGPPAASFSMTGWIAAAAVLLAVLVVAWRIPMRSRT